MIDLYKNDKQMLASLPHAEIVSYIEQNLPAVLEHSKNYGKRQSQFMDNMLTCSHPTPIRNLRQISAEIENTMQALREAYFRQRRDKLVLKKKQLEDRDLTATRSDDWYRKEELQIDIEEKQAQLEAGSLYISGAIRRIANHLEQFKSIMAMLGVESVDEIDFEAEEERYHIMKAFDQALCAARATSGRIDEGNHIYFYQIGISGAAALLDVTEFLRSELAEMQAGREPGHELILEFLNRMAEKYKGCSKKYALYKGQTGEISKVASLTRNPNPEPRNPYHD